MDVDRTGSEVRIHEGGALEQWGPDARDASAALVLLHGRGSSPGDMLGLARVLVPGRRFCVLAPQAANGTWYPRRFLAPLAENEPWLGSALNTVDGILKDLVRDGLPNSRIALGGFSQGACLALEYAARHPTGVGALAAFSGAVIGPPGRSREASPGTMGGTAVFIGCGDLDAHIPLESVRETSAFFRRLGADVTERIYPGLPHTINQDEIDSVRSMLTRLAEEPA